jgi:hypothetical protein
MPSRDKLTKLVEPTLIRSADVPCVVWGDDESGFVNDLFYVLSEGMVFVTITIPRGGFFRSSDKNRAFFDTHECLYVLEGEYTVQNPETGETRIARRGEMVFMPEKCWLYGYNFADTELRLLECIAPPTNQAALAHVPRPKTIKEFDSAAFEDFRTAQASEARFHIRGRENAVNAVIGGAHPVLFRVLASTERVFLSEIVLRPNSRSAALRFPFDVCYHGMEDIIHIHAFESGDYLPLQRADVAFLPANTPHRLFNHSSRALPLVCGGAGPFGRIAVS